MAGAQIATTTKGNNKDKTLVASPTKITRTFHQKYQTNTRSRVILSNENMSTDNGQTTTTTTNIIEGPVLPPVPAASKRIFWIRHGEVINPGGTRSVYYGAQDVMLPGTSTAVVCHLQVTRCVVADALQISLKEMVQKVSIATASITCIDYNNDNTCTVHFQSFKPATVVGLQKAKDGAN